MQYKYCIKMVLLHNQQCCIIRKDILTDAFNARLLLDKSLYGFHSWLPSDLIYWLCSEITKLLLMLTSLFIAIVSYLFTFSLKVNGGLKRYKFHFRLAGLLMFISYPINARKINLQTYQLLYTKYNTVIHSMYT